MPTVRPAAMDGTDPVLTYPKVPPEAVKAPRMYAGSSFPYDIDVSFQVRSISNATLKRGLPFWCIFV